MRGMPGQSINCVGWGSFFTPTYGLNDLRARIPVLQEFVPVVLKSILTSPG